jgi:D-ribose pyranose/furanose isomerase RbsD
MIVRNVPLMSFIAAPVFLVSKKATTIVTRGGSLSNIDHCQSIQMAIALFFIHGLTANMQTCKHANMQTCKHANIVATRTGRNLDYANCRFTPDVAIR